MADRITKTQRWIDLISFLVARRFPVTQEQIFESIPWYARRFDPDDARGRESLRRTFERDKEELRRAGIPIETVRFAVDREPYENGRLSPCQQRFFSSVHKVGSRPGRGALRS